jgi:hypothetical protein
VETTYTKILLRTNKFRNFTKHNCHHVMHPYNKIMRRFQKILDQNCTLFKNTYYKSHKSSFVPKKDFEVGEDLRCYLRSIEKEILSQDTWTKRFINSHYLSGSITYRTCAIITRGFLKAKAFIQWAFYLKFWPYLWLVFKSGLQSRLGCDCMHALVF